MSTLTAAPAAGLHLARTRARRLQVALGVRSSGLLVLGLLLGAGAGLGAVGFRELIRLFTEVFSGHAQAWPPPSRPRGTATTGSAATGRSPSSSARMPPPGAAPTRCSPTPRWC